jgi:hypothetical protein
LQIFLCRKFASIQKVHTFGERKSEAKKHMGSMHEKGETKTGRKIVEESGVSPDTFRMRLAKLKRAGHPIFREISWSLDAEFTEAQAELLLSGRAKKVNVLIDNEGEFNGMGLANEPAPILQPSSRSKDPAKNQQRTSDPVWPIWVVLLITGLVSVPQMYQITSEIKGAAGLTPIAWTAVLTAVPFLFVLARIKGVFAWIVLLMVMGYTAFCNATAIFAGLTHLDEGTVLRPTRFLEVVTNMLNAGYIGTARFLAVFMALLATLTELLAFSKLSNGNNWNSCLFWIDRIRGKKG